MRIIVKFIEKEFQPVFEDGDHGNIDQLILLEVLRQVESTETAILHHVGVVLFCFEDLSTPVVLDEPQGEAYPHPIVPVKGIDDFAGIVLDHLGHLEELLDQWGKVKHADVEASQGGELGLALAPDHLLLISVCHLSVVFDLDPIFNVRKIIFVHEGERLAIGSSMVVPLRVVMVWIRGSIFVRAELRILCYQVFADIAARLQASWSLLHLLLFFIPVFLG